MKARLEDASIAHLGEALDTRRTASALEELFRREYPERRLAVHECEVARLYHKPGRSCHVTYRVHGSENGTAWERWFFARLYAEGESPEKRLAQAPQAWPGCGTWKPVSPWWERNGLLNAFPYDRKLPHLGRLLERDFVRGVVAANLDGFGLPAGWACAGVEVRTQKYIPYKRCLLRYALDIQGPDGEHRHFDVFSKTYKNSHSRYVYDVLIELRRRLAAQGDFVIPRPYAHVDEAHTLWQEAWPGEGLNDLGRRVGWTRLIEWGVPARVGRLLARLHQVELPEGLLRPADPPLRILGNAAGDAADILEFAPERRAQLEQMIERLRRSAPDGRDDAPRATLHGTFKTVQVLSRDDELALVDFDGVAAGDPAYDVAEFVASLVKRCVTGSVPEKTIREAIEGFIDAYAAAVPWALERRRLAWYATCFLLARIHSMLKKHESAVLANLPQAFETVEEWLGQAAR